MRSSSIKKCRVVSVDSRPIQIYDTTLRDGSQSEDVLFSVEDKLRVSRQLVEFGIDFIEGGWPGANPKDGDFFHHAAKLEWGNSRLVAFGATRRAGVAAEQDDGLKGLLQAGTPVVTIFGKSWPLHVQQALGITLAENLQLIFDSIRYLKTRVDQVFFDAEHFFDGYKADALYARQVLQTAMDAGADCLVLCDTNGGTLVHDVEHAVHDVVTLGGPLGVHCHNDAGLAVANSLAAVRCGAIQVQGTINGFGERCGNADLVAIMPNLALKMGYSLAVTPQMTRLTNLSRLVNEMANRASQKNQPFVGLSAFAHKGGIHVSAVTRSAATYEHIEPETVGNHRRVLVSEQSGRSNLVYKLREFGFDSLDPNDPRIRDLLQEIKDLEHRGYQFEGAEASFELRARRLLGQLPDYFSLKGFRVIDERIWIDHKPLLQSDASVRVAVGDMIEHTAADGNGPVNALDSALRKALIRFYPTLADVRLVDFKVRILSIGGTDAVVRVLIESEDRDSHWGTVGVSANIIEASYEALVDSVRYKLLKDHVVVPGH
ncbi:MAG: citramalate synthase [Magnetococcales bacterium]|nr:citramalate synthase [Magnetococcales bacterium]